MSVLDLIEYKLRAICGDDYRIIRQSITYTAQPQEYQLFYTASWVRCVVSIHLNDNSFVLSVKPDRQPRVFDICRHDLRDPRFTEDVVDRIVMLMIRTACYYS